MILATENSNKTLYEIIFAERNFFLDMVMIAISVVFLGIMANISIPLWPVPITMQTFGVFLIAFFFGSRKGAIAIISYALAGVLGLGVFNGHKSGLAALIGPTAGYIVGFLIMTLIVGLMIEKGYGRTWKSVLFCMLAGEITLYAFGLSGLWIYLGYGPIIKVLQLGLLPFIIGDLIKAFAAAALFPYLWNGSEKLTL